MQIIKRFATLYRSTIDFDHKYPFVHTRRVYVFGVLCYKGDFQSC